MKRTTVCNVRAAAIALFLLAPAVAGIAGDAAPIQEKAYDGAVVALIDYENGLLGASYLDERTNQTHKLSLRVDLKELTVTNQLNQDLEFVDVQVGDNVDIATIVRPGEQEAVVEIVDYNQIRQD